jgi:hypothetical protein
VAGVVLGMETINQAKSGTAKVLFAICPLVLVAVVAKLLSRNLQVARSHGTLFSMAIGPGKAEMFGKHKCGQSLPKGYWVVYIYIYIYIYGYFLIFF